VIGVAQDADGIEARVRTRDGEHSLRAGWVVGCDGAHSAGRDLMGVEFEGRPFRKRWSSPMSSWLLLRQTAAPMKARCGCILTV
jgi:2-polyprenyl-6-methoxyphenol hydroxylase-like FAD-dependent oxidoreductase